MARLLPSLTFAGLLSFSPISHGEVHNVGIEVINGKQRVADLLSLSSESTEKNRNEENFFFELTELLENTPYVDEATRLELTDLLSQKELRKEIYEILKENFYQDNGENLVRAILLGLLSGSLFHNSLRRNLGKNAPKVGAGVSMLTTGGLYSLQGIFPEVFTLSEVSLIGWYMYNCYKTNKKNDYSLDTSPSHAVDISEEKAAFLEPFQDFHEPVVYYTKEGKPLLWNKKMEQETGYTFQEILDYYNKHGDVMNLLYKGPNLEKVRRYLSSLHHWGVGYQSITFTLTTKYGEEKTFLWSVLVDEDGGTLRFARYLDDLEEVKRKLYETEQKLLRDKLTGTFNMNALELDFEKIINNRRRKQTYMKAMFDIDNFKAINDKFGHNIGNLVLKEIVQFIKSKIRETDKLYRLHGDEFVILFESDNLEEIVSKITAIREGFFELTQSHPVLNKGVGTSWGILEIPPLQPKGHQTITVQETLKKVDHYMYAVKYVRLISEELVQRGILHDPYLEKNAIGVPKFDGAGEFIGIEVIHSKSKFFLSLGDLELITQRKKELEDSHIRTS